MDTSKVRLLEPFLLGPDTVAHAAERRGVSASAMGYWVKRFVELELLRLVGDDRPARYQATADEFVFDPTHAAPFEDILRRMYAPTWERMVEGYVRDYRRISEDWLIRIFASGDGLIHRVGLPAWQLDDPARPVPDMALNTWAVLRLRRERAQELQRELRAVFERYRSDHVLDEPIDEYIVHLGLVRAASPG